MTEQTIRRSGLSTIGEISWGTHFCLFYEAQQDLCDVVIPYLKSGLENEELCLWVVAQPISSETRDALRRAIPGLDRHLSDGDLEILSPSRGYLQADTFDPQQVIEGWGGKLDQALERGYAGLRVAADQAWLEKKHWRAFADCEKEVHQSIANQRMLALCAYPVDAGDASAFFDVARTHDFTVTRRHGSWESLGHVSRRTKELEESKRALEGMNLVNQALQGTNDLEQATRDVLEVARTIFDCDRAWLFYPCDPDAVSCRVLMVRAQPEFPCTYAGGPDLPVDPDMIQMFQVMKAAKGPVQFGPASEHPLAARIARQFSFQSMMATTLYPQIDKPYMFGLHQCSYLRTWTPQETRLFQEIGLRLAGALTSLLMLRRLRESESKLAEAQSIAHVGHWERDIAADRITFSDEAQRIFGLSPQERILNCARLLKLIHPEDRPRMIKIAAETLQSGQHYDTEFRVLRPNGEVRFVHARGRVTRDALGQPQSVFVTVQDITERWQAEGQLRASEARFRTFVDHDTDAFFLVDDQYAIRDVNRQACESLGYAKEELIRMTPFQFDTNYDRRRFAPLRATLDAGKVLSFESQHRRKDGTVFPVEVRIRGFWNGERRFAICLAQDITERKRAQESLTLFRSLLDHSNEIIEVVDVETGRFLDINESACLAHGYTRQEYLTLKVADVNPQVAARRWGESREQRKRSGSCIFESQHRRKDGSVFPVDVNLHYICLDRDYFLVVIRDITERKRVEKALKHQAAELRRLSTSLLKTQDEERRRLARDLHDSLAQALSGVALNLALVSEHRPRLNTEAARALREARAITLQCEKEVRALSYLLHPPLLEELGLVATLRSYAKGFGERSRIRTTLELSKKFPRLPSDIELALFRVAQEALANVQRHSGSSSVTMHLHVYGRQVIMEVSDHGCGVPHDLLTNPERHTTRLGVGLLGMRERLRQIGGRLEILAGKGGTTVKAAVLLGKELGHAA